MAGRPLLLERSSCCMPSVTMKLLLTTMCWEVMKSLFECECWKCWILWKLSIANSWAIGTKSYLFRSQGKECHEYVDVASASTFKTYHLNRCCPPDGWLQRRILQLEHSTWYLVLSSNFLGHSDNHPAQGMGRPQTQGESDLEIENWWANMKINRREKKWRGNHEGAGENQT